MGKYKKNNKQLNTLGKRDKLTEAPDDLGFLTDDEIEEQERQEFEKRLAQRKAQRDTAKSQELDRIEQEKQKEQARKEAEAKGKELYAKVKDLPFEEWFDILVPQSGKAPTVAGEIVRAVNRIAYRYWNDSDKFYDGYGRETCGSTAAYLYEMEPFTDLLIKMVDMNDDTYEQATNQLCDIAKDYLEENPELFGTINEHDSRSTKEYDIDAISEFDEPHDFEYTVHLEDYVNDSLDICLADFVKNGDVDSFEIVDRLEEDANAECNTYNEIHCDRPWSHGDTEYTFVELTKEQYETLRNVMDRSYYFDSYIQELYNEYGDPNAEEENEEDDEYEDEEESLKEAIKLENYLQPLVDGLETYKEQVVKYGKALANGRVPRPNYKDFVTRFIWDIYWMFKRGNVFRLPEDDDSFNDKHVDSLLKQAFKLAKISTNEKDYKEDNLKEAYIVGDPKVLEIIRSDKEYGKGGHNTRYTPDFSSIPNGTKIVFNDINRWYPEDKIVFTKVGEDNWEETDYYKGGHRSLTISNHILVHKVDELDSGCYESLKEDTVKQGNKWVNKGNTGKTHGEFKTKKQADAQRKAMFVNKKKNSNWGK